MSYRILLVDDEPDILEFVGYNLNKEGFQVHTASNGREAVDKALEIKPHLILLDVMMPEMDGMETCERIRSHPELSSTLIAFLTARSEDYSQLAGFDAGADDYITKPIKVKILVSRIKAMLKRIETGAPPAALREGKSIQIDRERYVVVKDGREITMPRKEFNLLTLLYSKPQKVFSRDEIFTTVWGNDVIVGDRTIDVHIRKLREKIGEDHIVTVKGVGYKYEE
ncbi:MAG: response regulator transcription factor [Alistipes sp.]|nr:response regulator transcription factor [Alistipes sp.]